MFEFIVVKDNSYLIGFNGDTGDAVWSPDREDARCYANREVAEYAAKNSGGKVILD